jgi:PAS domain S-box-containing protein
VRTGPFEPADIRKQPTELDGAHLRIAQLEAEIAALKASAESRLSLARHVADERSLLRTLIDNMPDQIYVKDVDGRFVLANTATADCIGVATADDLLGKSDLQLFPGECGQRFHSDEQAVIRSGESLLDQLEENINHSGVRR